jgi:hypothetical protein
VTTPNEDPLNPTKLTAFNDPKNVSWVSLTPVTEETPYDEGELDEDGLTEGEFDMVFNRPAADVPIFLLAAGMSESEDVTPAKSGAFQSTMDPDLKRYWLQGAGAAKIGWGTPGAFKRCVSNLREHFPQATEGLCANLYHEATGHWPGEDRGKK